MRRFGDGPVDIIKTRDTAAFLLLPASISHTALNIDRRGLAYNFCFQVFLKSGFGFTGPFQGADLMAQHVHPEAMVVAYPSI